MLRVEFVSVLRSSFHLVPFILRLAHAQLMLAHELCMIAVSSVLTMAACYCLNERRCNFA